MSKLPSFQFYPGDWMKDPALRKCSPAARGVWMDVLCLMFESEERGVLVTNGVTWTLQDVASAVSGRTEIVEAAFQELVVNGVVKVDEIGRYYSKRLIKDEKERQNTKKRVQKHRGCNADVTPHVTPLYEDEDEDEVSLESSLKEVPAKSSALRQATTPEPTLEYDGSERTGELIEEILYISPRNTRDGLARYELNQAVERLLCSKKHGSTPLEILTYLRDRTELYAQKRANSNPKYTIAAHNFFKQDDYEHPEKWNIDDEKPERKPAERTDSRARAARAFGLTQ